MVGVPIPMLGLLILDLGVPIPVLGVPGQWWGCPANGGGAQSLTGQGGHAWVCPDSSLCVTCSFARILD